MTYQQQWIAFALLLATALPLVAQEQKPGTMPDKPVTKEELKPEAYQAFTAPLEATVTIDALQAAESPKQSFSSATCYYHAINAINHEHGGFEPMAFRPKFRALANDGDKVVLDEEHCQSVAEGFYDGARVRVYQAIDGKLVKIRDGIVPKGGHHASGWLVTRGQLTTLKGKTDFKIKMDSSFLPDREYWFCVKAMDKFNQFSEPSNAVSAHSGKETKGQEDSEKIPGWQRFDDGAPNKPAPPQAPKNLRVSQEGNILQFSWDAVESEHLAGYKIFVSCVPPEKQRGFGLQLPSRDPHPDRIIQKHDIVFVDCLKTSISNSDRSPYVCWPALRKVSSPFKTCFIQEPYGLWSDGADGYPAKWEFVKHPEPIPAGFVGRGATCLQWRVESDALTGFPVTPYGGKTDTFYPALQPGEYTVEAWVRGSGQAQLVFVCGPFAPKGVPLPYKQQAHAANTLDIPPVKLPLTEQWNLVKGTFTVPSYFDKGLGYLLLSFQGPGTLFLDNLKIYKTDLPYGEYAPLTLQRIHESNMRFMRTHELIKTFWGYTFDGASNYACGNNYSARSSHNHTFYTLLENMRKAGNISPWLQIEMCMSEEEWLAFAEWFCAPYDPDKGDTPAKKPWAYKRWSMGQKKPWIDEFPEFAFEISNETWNQTFKPYDWDWGMDMTDGANGKRYSYGATYGLYNEYVINILRSSPYWTKAVDSKTKFTLCGWTAALAFGAEAARMSPSADEVTYAAYAHNSGIGDPKSMSDFKRFYIMQWPLSAIMPQFSNAQDGERRLRAEGRSIESGVYEYGYAYFAMPGDPVEAKEVDQQLARSMTGAVAMLDGSLTNARLGAQDQAFFTFGHTLGIYGSHTTLPYGGHPYPFWKALTLYNTYGTGTFLDVKLDKAPRWDFPAYEAMDNMTNVKRPAMPAAPLVSVHASTRDGRVTLFVISRKLDNFPLAGDDGFTPTTVKLPFNAAKKITLHKLAGDPRTDDRFEELHKIETIDIPATSFNGTLVVNDKTGADARGLPPASILCYVFEGATVEKIHYLPTARFQRPEDCVVGKPAVFKNLSVDRAGGALSFTWKLGSAGESKDKDPSATFAEAGIEKIELTVNNATGRSDTLLQQEHVVGIEFGGSRWRPHSMPPWAKSARAKRGTNGQLIASGQNPLSYSGYSSILSTDPRYRKDFVLEAVIEKIESPAKDPKACGGLVLSCETKEGLGFGWNDYQMMRNPASLLLMPNGAVRILAGQGDQAREVLPAGSATFPAKLRITVKDGKAIAEVETGGKWKQVAEFANLSEFGLMPGLATSGNSSLVVSSASVTEGALK